MAKDAKQARYNRLAAKRDRYIEVARRCFRYARMAKDDHRTAHAKLMRAVHGQPEFQKLPGWCKYYVCGVIAQLEFERDTTQVEWRLYLDGRYVTNKEVPDGRWCDVKGGAFFWKGTDQVWLQGELRP